MAKSKKQRLERWRKRVTAASTVVKQVTPDLPPNGKSYDQIEYPQYTHPDSHPRKLEMIATLFGMKPPPTATCSVLELGCATGSNLIPMAFDLPDAKFVGVDYSARQIEKAKVVVSQKSLTNIHFHHIDIMNIDDTWGQFDYIICYGIFSWVPLVVQQKVLEICKQNLSRDGVALICYNTYPGWHSLNIIRDAMLYHNRAFKTSDEQLASARSILPFLIENMEATPAYKLLLTELSDQIKEAEDAYLFHDHLEKENNPCYFREFIYEVNKTSLQYLGETDLGTMYGKPFSQKVHDVMRGGSIVEQGQYFDFLCNRSFRKSLVCHTTNILHKTPDRSVLKRAVVCLNQKTIQLESDAQNRELSLYESKVGILSIDKPSLKFAVNTLIDLYPGDISFEQLYQKTKSQFPQTQLPVTDFIDDLFHLLEIRFLDFWIEY